MFARDILEGLRIHRLKDERQSIVRTDPHESEGRRLLHRDATVLRGEDAISLSNR